MIDLKRVLFLASLIVYIKAYTITNPVDTVILPIQTVDLNHKNSFIRIVHNKTSVVECPPGTHFDKKKLTCEFTTYKISTFPKLAEPCPDSESYRDAYPNPDNCRNFILCGDAGSFLMNCPGNLLYNKNGRCDYPQSAGCCEYPAKITETVM